VKPSFDLGRPALRGGRLAWHTASRKQSRIMLKSLANGTKRVVAQSRIGLLKDPALFSARIAWVDSRSGASHLRLAWVRTGNRTTLESLKTRRRAFWTTSMGSGVVYATRWTLSSGAASIYRTGF
jgi:hypothetical protein